MNPPNNAPARMHLPTAEAAILTNSAILEAAGVAEVPTFAQIGPHGNQFGGMKLHSLWSEGKFRLHRIVSPQTKFDNCLQAMYAEQSDIVRDLMEKGPADNAYDELKTANLERHSHDS